MAGTSDFPYTPVPASLKRLLEKVPTVGRPDKVDGKWMGAMGFGGGNNLMSMALLKQVGILDGSGAPTDLWTALRAKDRKAFGAGLKRSYAALFAMYPDANHQDDEALMAFARAHTGYAEGTQKLAVRTFKTFAGFGDFDGSAAPDGDGRTDDEEKNKTGDQRKRTRDQRTGGGGGVGLTVNIQLQLPPSTDGEIYDKLFEAMAKHLKGLITLE